MGTIARHSRWRGMILIPALGALSGCTGITGVFALDPPEVQGLRPAASATGFFVGPTSVLTNAHAVSNCTAITVGNASEGGELPASVVASDPLRDLAVLKVPPSRARPAPFKAEPDTSTLQSWVIVGYPRRKAAPEPEARFDRVFIDPLDFVSGSPTFGFNGPVEPGNSGSPVIDDGGAVVGVVYAKLNTEKIYELTGAELGAQGQAIPNRVIFDFLNANGVAFETARNTGKLSPQQLLELAHGFVRQIFCWH